MTTSAIQQLINKTLKSFENGFYLEACFISHILIKEELIVLYRSILKLKASEPVKLKLNEVLEELMLADHPQIKKIIKKSTLKSIYIWKKKFDLFYKQTKNSIPKNADEICKEALVLSKELNMLIHRYQSNISQSYSS